MLYTNSVILCADNSSINFFKCIKSKSLGTSKTIKNLDLVIGSVKQLRRTATKHRSKIKQKTFIGRIISTVKKAKRPDGSYISFAHNRVVLLADLSKTLGSRVYGPCVKEYKKIKNTCKALYKTCKFFI